MTMFEPVRGASGRSRLLRSEMLAVLAIQGILSRAQVNVCALDQAQIASVNAHCCGQGHRRELEDSDGPCLLEHRCTLECAQELVPLVVACAEIREQLADVPGFSNLMDSCVAVAAGEISGSDGGQTTASPCATVDLPAYPGRTHCIYVPQLNVPTSGLPLVLLLHGLGADGATVDAYLKFSALANDRGFILALPDGTVAGPVSMTSTWAASIAAPVSRRFWAGTDSCCNWWQSSVDDSGYLRALIAAIQDSLHIDPKRIFVAGHSNGGFMAHRMACDHADLVAGIVSLAGATFDHSPTTMPPAGEAYSCTPAANVHVLEIHGTADTTVPYNGPSQNDLLTHYWAPAFPSAAGTVNRWSEANGCDEQPQPLSLEQVGATEQEQQCSDRQTGGCGWGLMGSYGSIAEDVVRTAHGNCNSGGSAEL